VAYWSAWADLPMRFIGKEEKRVPDHWKSFVRRSSYITKSPRKAISTNPSIGRGVSRQGGVKGPRGPRGGMG